eukprot:7205945-Prymnesium_polylepis.3
MSEMEPLLASLMVTANLLRATQREGSDCADPRRCDDGVAREWDQLKAANATYRRRSTRPRSQRRDNRRS